MVVAIGFFDGVHLGHREVLGQLVDTARARGEESMVLTFWPHPRTVLRKEARMLRLLTSMEEKKALMGEIGVDRVEVLPFTPEFAALTMEEFFRKYIIGMFGASAVMIGYDNRMGSDCTDPAQLAPVARGLGLEVIPVPAVGDISSTRIRRALEEGDIAQAERMLGRPYSLHGVVVAGNRMGRTIGFPTANIQLYEPLKLVPANGVYSVEVETVGRKMRGMCNVGVRPTVGENNSRTIETNIFDFDEEIYGLDIKITFISRIRDERRFGSLEDLAAQLALDREQCYRNIL